MSGQQSLSLGVDTCNVLLLALGLTLLDGFETEEANYYFRAVKS